MKIYNNIDEIIDDLPQKGDVIIISSIIYGNSASFESIFKVDIFNVRSVAIFFDKREAIRYALKIESEMED